jgi:superfamily II DNA or RNA helicase
LNEEDVRAIREGYESREILAQRAFDDEIEALLRNTNGEHTTQVLATLIASGSMDVRIGIPSEGSGIFHEKIGIFVDSDEDAVSFKGSSNETRSAWHLLGNHESFEVFRSWVDLNELGRVKKHREYFEKLWLGQVPNVELLEMSSLTFERLRSVARPDLASLRQDTKPQITLFPHQIDALNAWENQNYRGILEHATGSGKTITALAGMQKHLEKGLPVLVIVPSNLLQEQWQKEIRRVMPKSDVLVVGGSNLIWKRPHRVEAFSSNKKGGQRIIVATVQTACKPQFLSRVTAGDHLFIVADEVHRYGSREFSNVLTLETGKRLGLSATPRRYGDPVGTDLILGYFGGIIPPPFTLTDAIKAGRLVPYEYHPHVVRLTANEEEAWERLTATIRREYAQLDDETRKKGIITDRLKLLLIRRARIAKKAEAKIPLALGLLQEEFTHGAHWLVYCEDSDQLQEISSGLKIRNLPSDEYFSGMSGASAETLEWFDQHGGILVSIKCLDEGVDIPKVSHALILASSKNPREYIQRRGRVLRVAPEKPEKHVATIHDALVVPTESYGDESYLSLVKGEIGRAIEFAGGALNRSARTGLLALANDLGIDIEHPPEIGIEDE